MNPSKTLRLNVRELPISLELIGPKGEILPFELKPKKREPGMYLNKPK